MRDSATTSERGRASEDIRLRASVQVSIHSDDREQAALMRASSFTLKSALHFESQRLEPFPPLCANSGPNYREPSGQRRNGCCSSMEAGGAMSVVLIFGLALGVGFAAVGLIGFLGWRRRMREA